MKRNIYRIACCSVALLLQACDPNPDMGQADQSTVAAASRPSAEATSPPITIKQNNGSYELADVIAWAMPTTDQALPDSLPSLQNYNRFKGVITDIKSADNARYEGRVPVAVDGKHAIAENIEDDYAWKALIDGPNGGASTLLLDSWRAISAEAGPNYLRRRGFDLTALACFSEGRTSTNVTALYLARYADKKPTLISYGLSTGSGGEFIQYKIHFGSVLWVDVPGATQTDFEGKVQPFGYCPYNEFL